MVTTICQSLYLVVRVNYLSITVSLTKEIRIKRYESNAINKTSIKVFLNHTADVVRRCRSQQSNVAVIQMVASSILESGNEFIISGSIIKNNIARIKYHNKRYSI